MDTHKKFGYARVSSDNQNLDMQIDIFQNIYGIAERDIFYEKESARKFSREQYDTLKNILRPGDTLVVYDLDRLGRNYQEIKKEWENLRNNKIEVLVHDMPLLNTKTGLEPMDALISDITLLLLAWVAEQELQKNKSRRENGIRVAKANGKHLGRYPNKKPDNWSQIYEEYKDKKITGVEAMTKLGITKYAFYKYLKEENK